MTALRILQDIAHTRGVRLTAWMENRAEVAVVGKLSQQPRAPLSDEVLFCCPKELYIGMRNEEAFAGSSEIWMKKDGKHLFF